MSNLTPHLVNKDHLSNILQKSVLFHVSTADILVSVLIVGIVFLMLRLCVSYKLSKLKELVLDWNFNPRSKYKVDPNLFY